MFCTILIISIILIMGYYLYKKCSIKEGFTFNEWQIDFSDFNDILSNPNATIQFKSTVNEKEKKTVSIDIFDLFDGDGSLTPGGRSKLEGILKEILGSRVVVQNTPNNAYSIRISDKNLNTERPSLAVIINPTSTSAPMLQETENQTQPTRTPYEICGALKSYLTFPSDWEGEEAKRCADDQCTEEKVAVVGKEDCKYQCLINDQSCDAWVIDEEDSDKCLHYDSNDTHNISLTVSCKTPITNLGKKYGEYFRPGSTGADSGSADTTGSDLFDIYYDGILWGKSITGEEVINNPPNIDALMRVNTAATETIKTGSFASLPPSIKVLSTNFVNFLNSNFIILIYV